MIGVDTRKHVHVAAVMDTIGGIVASLTIPTGTGGFQQLLDWATSFGHVLVFGIEGTRSYGATLASFLRRAGHKVVEAGRPDRRLRRMNGKSDTLAAYGEHFKAIDPGPSSRVMTVPFIDAA
ncbi:transposase [Streptomyces sp. NPDC051664]|uniref:IS110 family transposase n=1 Tax=Streptomyces sp. NPDC051664 TaxID=3365668 RepID=UPI0037981592